MEETAATKELKQMFTQIRDERRMYANTSSRIGDAFLSLLSYLDSFKKKDDNAVSELAIGDIQVSYDNANGALALTRISDSKALASLYATGGLTAYGAGSGMSGGGTSYDRLDKWSDYTTDKATYILSALLGDDLNTRLSAVESSALTSVDWSIITGKPSTFAPSAHTHLWADITDHPTQLSAFTNDAGFTTNAGTVTSVALSVPKGLSVSGSPVTASGTLAIALSSGYSIPTTAKQTQWDTAYTNSHTHANKSVLDGITSTLVSNWNSVYSWYTGITATDTDNIINKWQEIITFLDGISSSTDLNSIVDGINTSISNEVTRAKAAESANASNITTLQGYFSSGSARTAVKLLTARTLWGNSFDGTGNVSGNIVMNSADGTYIQIGGARIVYDKTNSALYVVGSDGTTSANFYATGGVTAYGAGSGTSGGGTSYDRLDKWSDYTTDKATYILSALLGDDLNTRLSAVESSALTSVDWSIITGKPSTFAPSAHTHLWADITDHPTQLSAFTNDAGFTTNAGTVTSVALSVPKGLSVSGSPVTASGTLAIALSSGYSIPTTAKQTQWDSAYTNSHTHANKSVLDGITSTLVSNWNSVYSWYTGITATDTDNIINKWQEIIAFLDGISSSSDLNAIVSGINTSISNEVTRAKDSESVNASNITTLQGYFSGGSAKTATKLLTVRSLWGNSFDGTDDVSGNITMKPDDGTYIQIGGARIVYDKANSALYVVGSDGKTSANFYATGGLTAYGAGSGMSGGGTSYNRLDKWSDYTTDKATYVLSALLGNDLNTRVAELESSTLKSVDWSIIANKPSVFAPAPHTHLWADITDAPTTLAGYGITDANISNGIITLGANSITPLTTHQNISGKSDITHTHTVSINGTVKTIAATGGAAVDLGTYLTAHQSLTDYMTIEQTGIFVDGKIGALDVASVGGSGSYIQSILETDGKISAVAATLPTKLSQFTNDPGFITSSASITGSAHSLSVIDTRSSNVGPDLGNTADGVRFDFKFNSQDGLSDGGTYHGVLTFQQWRDASGGGTRQLGFTDNDNLWIRGSGSALSSYGSWKLFLNSINYSSYALPLHGTADTALKLYQGASSANSAMTFNWSGQTGQPSWLWGGNDGTNMYIYNPSNFNVAYASNSGALSGYTESSFLRYRGYLSDASNAMTGINTTDWKSDSANYKTPYGDSLHIQGFSSWYNRLDFGTNSRIYFWQAINPSNLTGCMNYVGTLAYTSDNVASATKLQTQRTLWGQSFDGTGDVGGALTFLTGSSGMYGINYNTTGSWRMSLMSEGQERLSIMDSGNVGIGTTAPSYKLDVNGTFHAAGAAVFDSGLTVTGNILATGGVTAYTTSDRRLKKNIRPLDSLRVIRTLGGTFEFDYRKDNRHSIGFIAQNVRKSELSDIVGELDGYLRINYLDTRLISLALGASVELDDEVTRLKKRVSELEKEVERLKAA